MAWLNEISSLLKAFSSDEAAEQTIRISPDRKKFQLIKALFVASITFYGKLFTQAKGRRVKLERSWIDTDKLRQEHDDAMEFRHTFAAHSGIDSAEMAEVVLLVDPDLKRLTPPYLVCELRQPDCVRLQDVKAFHQLVNHLHAKVEDKISKLTESVWEKEILPKGLMYWWEKVRGTPNQTLHPT